MFLRRMVFHPLAGKGPALRALLVSGQRTGRWNLTERLAGPSPEFRVQSFYDTLSDLQQAAEAARGRPPSPEMATLAAAAPALELEELVVPPPAGPLGDYVTSIVFEYAPGKLREVRALADKLVQRRAADGGQSAVSVRVSGGAPALMVVGFYQDLAALEATRAKAMADPAAAERVQRLSALLARPAELPNIYRVVARSG